MGLYDRDYYREDKPGIRLGGDWSAVTTLIVINAVVFLAEIFTSDPVAGSSVQRFLELKPDLLHNPWNAWQLLTYGFAHADIWHIAFNMFGLWVFGRDVETVYGRTEFFKVYISLIVLSGLFNSILQNASGNFGPVLGASGGVMGMAVLFACHFPRRTMYIIPIPVPIPAAVLVAMYIALDLFGTMNKQSGVAHWAHLGGAAFGFLYYKTGWSLFRLWPRSWSLGRIRLPTGRPKFRVHREAEEDDIEPEPDTYLTTGRMQKRVDELLEKISRSGEASLSEEERQFLAEASRRYQQRRR